MLYFGKCVAGMEDGLAKEDLQELAVQIDFSILIVGRIRIVKKIKRLFVLGLLCVSLSACSQENENINDVTSQDQWLSTTDSSLYETNESEKTEVFLVEPATTIDQTASDEEKQRVLQHLSQLDVNDFAEAVVYDFNNTEALLDNQVTLLFQSEINDIQIYGYKSAEYGFRGIILCLNGEYSYFDIIWRGRVGELKFFEQDFDNDGMTEIAFCFEGAMGTGVAIYRLVMFDDVKGNGKLAAYEFTPDMQLEQFEDKIQFVVDMQTKKLNILKSGENVGMIDWERFADETEENYVGVDCLNQTTFEINEDGIKMCADIGILLNQGGPTIFFTDEEGGNLYLDVMYSNGIYEID